MTKSKRQIAKEWEELTFTPMKGVNERSIDELSKVLAFEKKNRKR